MLQCKALYGKHSHLQQMWSAVGSSAHRGRVQPFAGLQPWHKERWLSARSGDDFRKMLTIKIHNVVLKYIYSHKNKSSEVLRAVCRIEANLC